MKYIKFRNGRGVYHIACKGEDFTRTTCYGHSSYAHNYVNMCNGNYPMYSDDLSDRPPGGRLCARCKKEYLKDHTEEDLLLELI